MPHTYHNPALASNRYREAKQRTSRSDAGVSSGGGPFALANHSSHPPEIASLAARREWTLRTGVARDNLALWAHFVMRHSFLRLSALAAVAFGLAAGPPRASAENIMSACAGQWKQAQAAGTTGGETWPQFLAQCRTRLGGATPPSAAFAPAPPPQTGSLFPWLAVCAGIRAGLVWRACGRWRAPSTTPNSRPGAVALRTPSCGSIFERASTITPEPIITGAPARAHTCARPTRICGQSRGTQSGTRGADAIRISGRAASETPQSTGDGTQTTRGKRGLRR